jgi:zinc finger MYND domain-containing protein 10
MKSAQAMDDFLTPYEAEYLIQEIHEIDIKEYGSKEWFKQHETIDRLNIQAHKNAMASTDEFVMEAFVTHDKITALVAELLSTETWKAKIFPILKADISNLSSIKSYMCLYHEAAITNLLEVMLYHRTACESSEDALVELIDYCYRKFVALNS